MLMVTSLIFIEQLKMFDRATSALETKVVRPEDSTKG